mgnify:CR=1 FL=1
MLSQKTIDTVKATIPVLEESGVALTTYFYDRMFTQNPEVKKYFNQSHQLNASQPKALATAVLAFAKNIDNLIALGDAVELIAQKHAALQMKPEHYPIVGENLIESIKEVLGLDNNNDIVIAWTEAYGLLAKVLIGREKEIYDDNLEKYGWNDFKEFKVFKKEDESSNACSFYLKSDDIKKIDFKPGQYITVRIPVGETTTMRNYSISSATGENYIRITVKKEGKGIISQYLHDQLDSGDSIGVAPPCGEFFLDLKQSDDKPLVFLSAGIGITPLLSMLLSELQTDNTRDILFICGKKNSLEHPFADVIQNLSTKNNRLKTVFFYEENVKSPDKQGLIDLAVIRDTLGTVDARYYFCGPSKFMHSIESRLQQGGISDKNINFEFFGSKG